MIRYTLVPTEMASYPCEDRIVDLLIVWDLGNLQEAHQIRIRRNPHKYQFVGCKKGREEKRRARNNSAGPLEIAGIR
jgi:hypothetical protein